MERITKSASSSLLQVPSTAFLSAAASVFLFYCSSTVITAHILKLKSRLMYHMHVETNGSNPQSSLRTKDQHYSFSPLLILPAFFPLPKILNLCLLQHLLPQAIRLVLWQGLFGGLHYMRWTEIANIGPCRIATSNCLNFTVLLLTLTRTFFLRYKESFGSFVASFFWRM